MFKVWVIFQQCVYRHTCFGIFTNPTDACREAERIAREDVDSHHSYDVVPFVLNKAVEWEEGEVHKYSPRYGREAAPIASYRKPREAKT